MDLVLDIRDPPPVPNEVPRLKAQRFQVDFSSIESTPPNIVLFRGTFQCCGVIAAEQEGTSNALDRSPTIRMDNHEIDSILHAGELQGENDKESEETDGPATLEASKGKKAPPASCSATLIVSSSYLSRREKTDCV